MTYTRALPVTFILVCACLNATSSVAQYKTSKDVTTRERARAPDQVIKYGEDALQFGHLRLPDGAGPHPVLIVIHGGCWLSFADLNYMDHFCEEFRQAGVATWSIEYRRVDNAGGGWPNTFLDVADAVEHLEKIAPKYELDLTNVVVAGHSSGGHLALWVAARNRIPESSALFSVDPLRVRAAVSLAGPGDLESLRPTDNVICGGDVIDQLVGGTPESAPAHWEAANPANLVPTGIKQRLLTGADDHAISPGWADAYAELASTAGDDVLAVTLPDAGHFELVWPGSSAWPDVRKVILTSIFDESER